MEIDHFDGGPSSRWTPWLQGTGRIEPGNSTIRLVTQYARVGQYSDAQIDDYHVDPKGFAPSNLSGASHRRLWRPPLKMSVYARAAPTNLVGTAGFGFWNDPFTLSGGVTALPQAVWFFYASPPSNIALVPGVPGWGWKAAIVNATLANAMLTGMPTAIAALWARSTGHTRSAARWVQRISGAQETLLQLDWTEWHTYELDWQSDSATFCVDRVQVLQAPHPPRGPLGFVAWVDNQYAIATPRGNFRFGLLDAPGEQWLELDWVRIEG